MNKEKIKIGILGCGRVCEHYIEKILISERVGTLYQVIACCDVDKSRFEALFLLGHCLGVESTENNRKRPFVNTKGLLWGFEST